MRAHRSGIVVIGDALLDRDVDGDVARVCPDAPVPVLEETALRSRPGGAALAAVLAAVLAGPGGPPVTLVSPVCSDEAGRELVELVEAGGVRLMALPAEGRTTEKIRLRGAGQTLLRLDRGTGPVLPGQLDPRLAHLIEQADVVLVADYGRGMAGMEPLRAALAASGRPIVWDPHPRGAAPVPGCRVLTPNATELLGRFPPAIESDRRSAMEASDDPGLSTLTSAARRAHSAWRAASVAVTRGRLGALLVSGDGPPLAVPSTSTATGDTCGAGDCFAASTAVSLAAGSLVSEAVAGAVADAGRFVSSGAASAYGDWSGLRTGTRRSASVVRISGDAASTAAEVHRSGGTVVAAGGCFDILHAGHVSLLQAARRLGDCLIVCINSDASVRRLKGAGRPLNCETDRAATLAALDCVTAVAIFDEDTPEQAIRRLRPHVWVKGGDYDARSLPEAATLAEWGGQAAILPYLAGRSTTGLLRRATTPAS